MKNNKLTRARAQRQQEFVKQADGTEVLKSVESRQKQRRWSFEADIELVFPETKDAEGNVVPAPPAMARSMRLEAVSYSDAKTAREECKGHEAYLRSTNALFANSKIRVRAIPHETCSNVTLRQLTGYRDMSMLLDKALEFAVDELRATATGKSVGGESVAMDTAKAKEHFYKQAVEAFKTPVAKPAEQSLIVTP